MCLRTVVYFIVKTDVFENSMFKYVSATGGTITIIINNNNGPSGGQRGVEKSVSYIAGFVVQG